MAALDVLGGHQALLASWPDRLPAHPAPDQRSRSFIQACMKDLIFVAITF